MASLLRHRARAGPSPRSRPRDHLVNRSSPRIVAAIAPRRWFDDRVTKEGLVHEELANRSDQVERARDDDRAGGGGGGGAGGGRGGRGGVRRRPPPRRGWPETR